MCFNSRALGEVRFRGCSSRKTRRKRQRKRRRPRLRRIKSERNGAYTTRAKLRQGVNSLSSRTWASILKNRYKRQKVGRSSIFLGRRKELRLTQSPNKK